MSKPVLSWRNVREMDEETLENALSLLHEAYVNGQKYDGSLIAWFNKEWALIEKTLQDATTDGEI